MPDDPKLIARIQELLDKGYTLAAVARDRRVNSSRSTVHRIACRHNLRRRKKLPRETKQQMDELIRAGELSLGQIAARLGVSKSTVCVRRQQVITADVGELDSPRGVRPYRCGGCGHTVTLEPCAICMARGGKSERPSAGGTIK